MKTLKNNEREFYIITGGPGVGKTTLLNELSKSGFHTVPEEARRIIREQLAINGNGLPWKNKQRYAALMLHASLKTYKEMNAKESSDVIFFDRGILDTICYLNTEGIPISDEVNKIAKENRYNKKVFILPPWKEIYETDTERKQTWQEAVYTFEKMGETYANYDYQVIEVPKDSVENRKNFVLTQIVS